MATQGNNINISPTQLMVFTFAMVALMMAMAFVITNTVVNGQTAFASKQTNTASPQYIVSADDGAGTCVDATASDEEEATKAVGDHVLLNGHSYNVVGMVPSSTYQVNEDNDTTITHTTTVDNLNSGNTDVLIKDNGNTNVDNRDSGNTTRTSTTTNTTTVDNRDQGNITNSGNTTNSGNSTMTEDNDTTITRRVVTNNSLF